MPRQQDPETMIREAAYFRYLEHGCSDGHDLEDWLAAEAEFAAARSEQPMLRLKTRQTAAATAAAVAGEQPKRVAVKAATRKPGNQGKAP